MKVCYVAGPFRGANAWEIEQNVRRAETIALEVWKRGYAAICPHANTRFFHRAVEDDALWLDGDLELLRRSDVVVMTPDWQRSSGASEEHAEALKCGILVVYGVEDLPDVP